MPITLLLKNVSIHSQRPAAPSAEPRPRRIGLLAPSARQKRSRLRCRSGRRARHIHRHIHRLTPSRHRNPQRRGNPRRLNRVELAHAPRHEEALDHAQNRRNPRPEKAHVKNSQPCAPQIEVVNPEGSQKERQQNADHLVAAYGLVLLIEDCLRIGVRCGAHLVFSSLPFGASFRHCACP